MVRRICLDTSFVIELVKGSERATGFIKNTEAEYALSAITVFELLVGSRSEDKLLSKMRPFVLLDFDAGASVIAGRIYKKLREQGTSLDMRDVFIASVCIKNDFELLTLNAKHFERLKKHGLKLVE